MANRSFRQRPLDIHKTLDIVRDLSLLDQGSLDGIEGLPIKEALQAANQAAPAPKEKKAAAAHDEKPGVKEIPIPGVNRIPTYELDYLPAFRERYTYLRGRGGSGYFDPTFVEYDLDVEDEAWLVEFNGEQERLSSEKFEAMLWRLDVGNAEATDKIFAFQGSALAERLTPEACATTDYFPREEALQLLEELCPSRDTIRVAVYDYWLKKRAKLGQPLIRRLQAPTPINNQDPYRVFRPREKTNRPQTRRKKENNADSYDRLQTIAENIRMALQLFELIVKRERKKRDMTYVISDWQQLQIKQRFNPRGEQEAIEQEYQNAAKNKNVKRPVGFEKLPEANPAATNALLDFRNKKNKKRKKLGLEAQLHAVAHLPPPPPSSPQPNIGYCAASEFVTTEVKEGKLDVPVQREGRSFSCRVGRGGRLIVDRCRPFTYEPMDTDDAEDGVKPMHELPNPYEKFSSTVVKLRIATPATAPPANANGQAPSAK